MCTGRLPYPTIDPVDMLKYLEQGHRLEKPTNSAAASEMYVDFINISIAIDLMT